MQSARRARSKKPSSPLLEELEGRLLLDGLPSFVALGAINGGQVTLVNSHTGATIIAFNPYPLSYKGGVSVALGDVDGDHEPEIITGPTTPGTVPLVRVFTTSGTMVQQFMAFDPAFLGGINVASADFTEDGRADIAVGAGAGGGPHVRVFNGDTNFIVRSFYAFPTVFHGGVNIAVGDVDNDGVADIICTPKIGGGPIVQVYSGTTSLPILRTFVLDRHGFSGGIRVAAGDINGDGHADIITATGIGLAATITILSGADGSLLSLYNPFGTTTGVSVASIDQDGDGKADVIVGVGRGLGREITIFKGTDHSQIMQLNEPGTPYQGFNMAGYSALLT